MTIPWGAAFCPECKSQQQTERVHSMFHADGVQEIRICEDCNIQYTVHYSLSHKEVDDV